MCTHASHQKLGKCKSYQHTFIFDFFNWFSPFFDDEISKLSVLPLHYIRIKQCSIRNPMWFGRYRVESMLNTKRIPYRAMPTNTPTDQTDKPTSITWLMPHNKYTMSASAKIHVFTLLDTLASANVLLPRYFCLKRENLLISAEARVYGAINGAKITI